MSHGIPRFSLNTGVASGNSDTMGSRRAGYFLVFGRKCGPETKKRPDLCDQAVFRTKLRVEKQKTFVPLGRLGSETLGFSALCEARTSQPLGLSVVVIENLYCVKSDLGRGGVFLVRCVCVALVLPE